MAGYGLVERYTATMPANVKNNQGYKKTIAMSMVMNIAIADRYLMV